MMRSLIPAAAVVSAGLLAASCARDASSPAAERAESWAVTAWGELYEVFPEVDPLVDGVVSRAHTHVTILDGFQPLSEGVVEIVLAGSGAEQVFRATEAVRPGIFNVEIAPKGAGEYRLLFRIESRAGREEIEGGHVRVGGPGDPGGLVAPAQPQEQVAGEPVSFLKEQQWRTTFATAWVTSGSLRQAAVGLARVRAPAGGEVTVTAAVDGVLRAQPWPHVGQRVGAGETLAELAPRVAQGESLAALEATVVALETELQSAASRRNRLEELLAVEATSPRELDDARTREATLEARLKAARKDLGSSRAAREGRGDAERHALRAPFAGAVAEINASPGAAVAAGEPIARLVRTEPLWLEAELQPADATALVTGGVEGVLIRGGGEATRLTRDQVRVVAVAPEVDPAKGTVIALLEIAGEPGLLIGSTLEVELLLPAERKGIVIPTTSLVDDGGVAVVYLQVEGESFARREVEVDERQGELALVSGLLPGQRLVTSGADAIRRATLLSSGEIEGHVH
jgi:membrane fusion protein, heavy metal efflux system